MLIPGGLFVALIMVVTVSCRQLQPLWNNGLFRARRAAVILAWFPPTDGFTLGEGQGYGAAIFMTNGNPSYSSMHALVPNMGTKLSFMQMSDKSDFCGTKVSFVIQNWVCPRLPDKSEFCAWQNSFLFVLFDKINFWDTNFSLERQNWVLYKKKKFGETKLRALWQNWILFNKTHFCRHKNQFCIIFRHKREFCRQNWVMSHMAPPYFQW